MTKCGQCGESSPIEYYTEVNPEGGYGQRRLLICDKCLSGSDWDEWRERHNWPQDRSTKND